MKVLLALAVFALSANVVAQTVDDCTGKEFGYEIEQCTEAVVKDKMDNLTRMMVMSDKSLEKRPEFLRWKEKTLAKCEAEANAKNDPEMGSGWTVTHGRCMERMIDARTRELGGQPAAQASAPKIDPVLRVRIARNLAFMRVGIPEEPGRPGSRQYACFYKAEALFETLTKHDAIANRMIKDGKMKGTMADVYENLFMSFVNNMNESGC